MFHIDLTFSGDMPRRHWGFDTGSFLGHFRDGHLNPHGCAVRVRLNIDTASQFAHPFPQASDAHSGASGGFTKTLETFFGHSIPVVPDFQSEVVSIED